MASPGPKNAQKATKSGYECEFVRPQPDYIQTDCSVCLLVLRSPHLTSCCGKNFCKKCIKCVVKGGKSCPLCNAKGFTLTYNREKDFALKQLEVYCTHHINFGCRWRGALESLDEHLNVNPKPGNQLDGCVFVEVQCCYNGCGQSRQRRFIAKHQGKECPLRPFTCGYCRSYKATYRDVTTNHWPECKSYALYCPNNCTESTIERQNLQQHLMEDCPLQKVECEFKYAGCETRPPRRDLPEHLEKSLVSHLSLLARHLTEKNQKLTDKSQELTAKTQELTAGSQKLTKTNQKLTEEVKKLHQVQGVLPELTKKDQELTAKIQELTAKNQELMEEVEKVRCRVQGVVPELTKKNQELTAKSRELNRELTAKSRELNRELTLAGQKVWCQVLGVVPELTKNQQELIAKSREMEVKNQKLTAKSRELEVKNQELTAKIQELGVKNQELTVKGQELTAKTQELEVKNQELTEEVKTLRCGVQGVAYEQTKKNQELTKEVENLRCRVQGGVPVYPTAPVQIIITNFEQHKKNNEEWYSEGFYSHPQGYKMCLKVHSNGIDIGKGTHVSWFIYLMRGEFDDHLKWPFQGVITIQLLNQREDNNHHTKTVDFLDTELQSARVTSGERADRGWGYKLFIAHSELGYNAATNCQHLMNDCLCFRMNVELK